MKSEYISALKRHYGACTEYSSMLRLIDFFKVKQLIPPSPAVYVIRYDDEFAKALSEIVADQIAKLNIIGTIVCIYDDKKHESAMEKYLPDYTVTVEDMHPRFIKKHLIARFPDRMHGFIESADFSGMSYGEALNLVTSAEYLSDSDLDRPQDVFNELACQRPHTPAEFSVLFADKDFSACADIISSYNENPTELYYAMCNALLGIENVLSCEWKAKSSPYYVSAKKWSIGDVKTVFGYVYDELKRSRTTGVTNGTDSLLYLLELSIQRYT